jgi:hypothetical protein
MILHRQARGRRRAQEERFGDHAKEGSFRRDLALRRGAAFGKRPLDLWRHESRG